MSQATFQAPQLANAEWFERHAVGNFGLASDPKLRAWKANLAKSRVRVIVSRAMILGQALRLIVEHMSHG